MNPDETQEHAREESPKREAQALITILHNRDYDTDTFADDTAVIVMSHRGEYFTERVEARRDILQEYVDVITNGDGPQVAYDYAEEHGYDEFAGQAMYTVEFA